MNKDTRTKAEVKITDFVRALSHGSFLNCSPREMQVIGWLMMSGGDRHAESHVALRLTSGLPERTYFRVLGRLERRGLVEICTDPRCPHLVFGDLGWRITANLGSDLLPTLAVVVQQSDASEQGKRAVFPPQEDIERLLTQPRPPGAEVLMSTNDSWDGASLGAGDVNKPPPKKGRAPTTRLREAFTDECRGMKDYWQVPITPSVKQMMGGLKWLLDQGYSEDVIKASFSFLGNVLSRQSVGPHRTMWEVYYQNKAELLKQGAMSMVGTRPGQKRESLLEQAQRRNRAVQ